MNFDFESLFKSYPNKEGKGRGMKKLSSTIKTTKDYDDFKTAMHNYLELCRIKGRIAGGFVKIWPTFCNQWKDYLDSSIIPEEPKSNNLSQLERIAKGQL